MILPCAFLNVVSTSCGTNTSAPRTLGNGERGSRRREQEQNNRQPERTTTRRNNNNNKGGNNQYNRATVINDRTGDGTFGVLIFDCIDAMRTNTNERAT